MIARAGAADVAPHHLDHDVLYIGASRYVDRCGYSLRVPLQSYRKRGENHDIDQLRISVWLSEWTSFGRRVQPSDWATLQLCESLVIFEYVKRFGRYPMLN